MTWQLQFDNPDFLGWLVVAAYLLAAVSCGWVALKTDKSVSAGRKIWGLLAIVLLCLGVNKQLNLQTLMIVIGRHAALVEGWFEHRRLVQAIFCAAFALLGLCLLGFFAATGKRFIGQNRLAFAGVIVLLFFVMLRSSTINHASQLIGINLKDEHWAWILELCGSILIALSAAATVKSAAESKGEL